MLEKWIFFIAIQISYLFYFLSDLFATFCFCFSVWHFCKCDWLTADAFQLEIFRRRIDTNDHARQRFLVLSICHLKCRSFRRLFVGRALFYCVAELHFYSCWYYKLNTTFLWHHNVRVIFDGKIIKQKIKKRRKSDIHLASLVPFEPWLMRRTQKLQEPMYHRICFAIRDCIFNGRKVFIMIVYICGVRVYLAKLIAGRRGWSQEGVVGAPFMAMFNCWKYPGHILWLETRKKGWNVFEESTKFISKRFIYVRP